MVEAEPTGPPPADVAAVIPWLVGAMVVAFGLAMAAVYLGLLWVSRRADVKGFVQGSAE